MKLLALLPLLAVPFVGNSQYTYQQLNVNFLKNEADMKSYTYENLRLYPVYAKDNFKSHFKNVGKYMPLTEAIQKKKVKVTEKDQSGTVNSLTVQNISSDTIIIICGDVVKGGKQDRIIETDMVLAPNSGKKELKVFCVESGRWNDGRQQASTAARTSRTNAPPAPASATATFNGHYNKGAMSLRKVVEKEKDQSKVWAEVDKINSSNKTQTSTKTYTALSNSDEYSKKLQQYVSFFQSKFSKDTNVIGVVVVSGNKVLGCDLFATSALFQSQFPSLLHSYATEAIVNGGKVTASSAVVQTYMDGLLKDEKTQQTTLKDKGSAFNDKGRKLRVSSFD